MAWCRVDATFSIRKDDESGVQTTWVLRALRQSLGWLVRSLY